MTEIAMPQLSDSMEQGLVLQWLIEDGAEVALGDELVEIETDKATMTYIAEVAGTLQIVAAEGTTVPVGETIAIVGARTETSDAPAPAAPVQPQTEDVAAAPPEPVSASPAPPVAANENGTANGDRTADTDADAPATPVARRLAAVHGIALAAVAGTGPRGTDHQSRCARSGRDRGAASLPPHRPSAVRPPRPPQRRPLPRRTVAEPAGPRS